MRDGSTKAHTGRVTRETSLSNCRSGRSGREKVAHSNFSAARKLGSGRGLRDIPEEMTTKVQRIMTAKGKHGK